MTQTLTAAVRAEAAPLDLDARLALSLLAMDERLDQAAVAFEVNTAHLPAGPVDFVAPLLPALAPQLAPASTPLADCLRRACAILAERGWCRGALRDEQGAICPIGAIRAAADSRGQADDACAVLLDAIQREFTDAETVPSWNDRQHGPAAPLRLLDRAAQLAASRSI
jgi:hypothetical protein